MQRKLLLIPTLALAGLLVYSTTAKAHNPSQPWHQEMVSILAAKLKVGEEEVASALAEVHAQIQAEHDQAGKVRFEARLKQLVEEGKLTQGQYEAWLDKHEELMAEQYARRQDHQSEMRQWAAEHDIDFSLLGPTGMQGLTGGHGMHGMHGDWQ